MKGRNSKKILISIVSAILVFSIVWSAIFNTKKNSNNVDVASINNSPDNVGKERGYDIKGPYFNYSSSYETSGKEIVKKASEALGTKYGLENGKGHMEYNTPYSSEELRNNRSLDCSGLIAWTLGSLGYTMEGLSVTDYEHTVINSEPKRKLNIPIEGVHWLTYGQADRAFSEAGGFKYVDDDSNKDLIFYSKDIHAETAQKYYATEISITRNNVSRRVNVLKVNDPITENYRYYNYYIPEGKNLSKKELPVGTIVFANNTLVPNDMNKSKYNHMWIYIGDLGVSEPEKVVEVLKSQFGIDASINDIQVQTPGSTHWRIESHDGDNGGVKITNGDPNQNEYFNNDKGKLAGAIWAFQIADDVPKEGQYRIKINKKSEETKKIVPGATFNVRQFLNGKADTETHDNVGKEQFVSREEENNYLTENNLNSEYFKDGYIKIDNTDKTDSYRIIEKNQPEGYDLNTTYGEIKIIVNKTIKDGKYKVGSLKVFYNGNGANRYIDIQPGEAYQINPDTLIDGQLGAHKRFDGSNWTEGYREIVKLDSTGTEITFEIINPVKPNSYQLSVGKKDAKTNEFVAGAEVEFDFHNDDTNQQSIKYDEPFVTGNSLKYFNSQNTNNVWNKSNWSTDTNGKISLIKTTGNDVYAFKEVKPPTGYKENVYKGTIGLKVYREFDKGIKLTGVSVHSATPTNDSNKINTGDKIAFTGNEQVFYLKYENNILSLENSKPDVTKLVGEIKLKANGAGIEFNYYNDQRTGSYDVNIQKVKNENKEEGIGGITFKVNGTDTNPTDEETGLTSVASNVPITKDNIKNVDRYKISEINYGNNTKLIQLAEPFILEVYKDEETYGIQGIRLKGANDETEYTQGDIITIYDVVLKDKTTVTVVGKLNGNTVEIIVPNKEKGGTFELDLEKIDYKTKKAIEGCQAEFDIKIFKPGQAPENLLLVDENGNEIGELQEPLKVDKDSKITLNCKIKDEYVKHCETSQYGYIIEITEIKAATDKHNLLDYTIRLKVNFRQNDEKYYIEYDDSIDSNGYPKEENGTPVGMYLFKDNKKLPFSSIATKVFPEAKAITINGVVGAINVKIPNDYSEGKYNLSVEKHDQNGNLITSNATFKVEKLTDYTKGNQGKENGDKFVVEENNGGNVVETEYNSKSIDTLKGKFNLSNIVMDKNEITTNLNNKQLYYWVFQEKEPPAGYIGLDYKIVVPVYFTKNGVKLEVHREGDAFAYYDNGDKKTLAEAANGKRAVQVSDFEINENTGIANLTITVPNIPQEGTYNIKIKKVDESGTKIKNEKTVFKVYAYNEMVQNGNNVTFSNPRTSLTKELIVSGTNTKKEISVSLPAELSAPEGITTGLNSLKISKDDAEENRTVYFIIDEKTAPDNFIKINFKIVLPITYSIDPNDSTKYIATKGEAFALVLSDNPIIVSSMSGAKKSLSEVETFYQKTECTEQDGVTITATIPNKHMSGTYGYTVKKVDPSYELIKNDKTEFNVYVLKNSVGPDRNKNISFNTEMALQQYNDKNEIVDVESKGLSAADGFTEKMSNIIIKSEDIGKTYYFITEEKVSPENYNGINYLVVVPITFSIENNVYVAKKGTGFAIVDKNNPNEAPQIIESNGVVSVEGIQKTFDEVKGDNVAATVEQEGTMIISTIPNSPIEGLFNFRLVKKIKGTENPLAGAMFTVKIYNDATGQCLTDKNGNTLDGKTKYETDEDGELCINENGTLVKGFEGFKIEQAGLKYHVVIEETDAPPGYIKSEIIEFDVVSVLKDKKYVLESIPGTITNAKKIIVRPGEIYVEAENTPIPVIHKGVKTVENQDSGYFANENHTWVINTTVPNGINEFIKYVVTDTIDERLEFIKGSVEVRFINGRKMVKDVDYLTNYDDATRVLNVTFIDMDANNIYKKSWKKGQEFSEDLKNIPDLKIEIKFKTRFAKDENGNIKALNQEIPNQAKLIYNNGYREYTALSEVPEVHTAGIKIKKVCTKDGKEEPLQGAVFQIAETEEKARKGEFLKVRDENGDELSSQYITATSGADGIAIFEGIQFGGDAKDSVELKNGLYDYECSEVSTKYWIVETSAPIGYHIDSTPQEVTLDLNSYNEISYTQVNHEINGGYSIEIEKKDSENHPLNGVNFTIKSEIKGVSDTRPTSDGKVSVTNGNISIVPDEKTTLNNYETRVGTVDKYNVKEEKFDYYLTLKNPIEISVEKTQVTEGDIAKYVVKKVNFLVTEPTMQKRAELIIYPEGTETKKTEDIIRNVVLTDEVTQVDIKVKIDEATNKITLNIINKPYDGKYKIILSKRNSDTDETMAGIPFSVNDISEGFTSDNDGNVYVTKGNEEEQGENAGFVHITKETYSNSDIYKIVELNNNVSNTMDILSNPVTLEVIKDKNKGNTEYIVNRIKITYTGKEGNVTKRLDIDSTNGTVSPNTYYMRTVSGDFVPVTFEIGTDKIIKIEINNSEKEGYYKFMIHKALVTMKNDNGEVIEENEPLENANFKVNNHPDQMTDEDGNTSVYEKNITRENVNTNDVWTITEISSGQDDIIKLKNTLKVYIKKEITQTEFRASQYKIEEQGGNATDWTDISETPLSLKVKLEDNREVTVSISEENGVIKLNVPNKEKDAYFSLSVLKMDKNTMSPMSGIGFKVNGSQIDSKGNSYTSDINGKVNIESNTIITGIQEKTYDIEEIYLPIQYTNNEVEKYTLIDKYGIKVRISFRVSADKTHFEVDKVVLELIDKDTKKEALDQREIIEASIAEFTNNKEKYIDGQNIVIPYFNEKDISYKLDIVKIDPETNSNIPNAKFTIYRKINNGDYSLYMIKEGNNYVEFEERTLGDKGELSISETDLSPNDTISYKIIETESQEGYINLLENVELIIKVQVDNEGDVTGTLGILPRGENSSILDVVYARKKLSEYAENIKIFDKKYENDGSFKNKFELKIPNKQKTTSTSLTLDKHEENSKENPSSDELHNTNKVAGAQFKARRYLVEGNSTLLSNAEIRNVFDNNNSEIVELSNVTTTKDGNNKVDELDNIKVNSTIYYELREFVLPTNFENRVSKVIIGASFDKDGNVNDTPRIMGIITDGSWIDWNRSEHEKYIQLTYENNDLKINWTNAANFGVKIHKKAYSGEIPVNENGTLDWTKTEDLTGSTFSVERVEPDQRIIYSNTVMGFPTLSFDEDVAETNKVYHYIIKEKEAKADYINMFYGVEIHAYIRTDEKGKISANPGHTYIELKDDKTIVKDWSVEPSNSKYDGVRAKALSDKYKIEISEDAKTANIYVANQKKTLSLRLLKTSDNDVFEGHLNGINTPKGEIVNSTTKETKGIEGVKFEVKRLESLTDRTGTVISEMATNSEGYIDIKGITFVNQLTFLQFVEIMEENNNTNTLLDGVRIILSIDARGIENASDMTDDRIDVVAVNQEGSNLTTEELEAIGLKAKLIDGVIYLTVNNPTEVYTFGLFKYEKGYGDNIGNIINSSDGIDGAKFRVTKLEGTKETEVFNGILDQGYFIKPDIAYKNKTYVYIVREIEPKIGHENILQGWAIKVTVQTDENAYITEDSIKYEIIRDGNNQKYTDATVRKYVKFNANINVAGRRADIQVSVLNPLAYTVTLEKYRAGQNSAPVSAATIIAEKVPFGASRELAAANDSYGNVSSYLYAIRTNNEIQKTLKLNGTEEELNPGYVKKSNITSEEFVIDDSGNVLQPVDGLTETWRIKETKVDAPYYNVLGNNQIIVEMMHAKGVTQLVQRKVTVDGNVYTVPYLVCNEYGQDVTAEYYKNNCIEIIEDKQVVNGKETGLVNFIVRIKNPAKYKIGLNKVVYDPNEIDGKKLIPLEGAEVTANIVRERDMSSSCGTLQLTNGKSSDITDVTTYFGEHIVVDIQEIKAPKGYENVFENKLIKVTGVIDKDGKLKAGVNTIIDSATGQQLGKYHKLYDYIIVDIVKDEDGYDIINVYLENPISFEFELNKLDTSNNYLGMTDIRIESSKSGVYYNQGNAKVSFKEENLVPGEEINYKITEISTQKNSAFINVFDYPICFTVAVGKNGRITIKNPYKVVPYQEAKPLSMVPYVRYDFVEKENKVLLELQNPTSVILQIAKKQAGSMPGQSYGSIPDTEFLVETILPDEHVEVQDMYGIPDGTIYENSTQKIDVVGGYEYKNTYKNKTNRNGVVGFKLYSMSADESVRFKITENKTAHKNYVNVLEGKYVIVDASVNAYGKITINNMKFYDERTDREITNQQTLRFLHDNVKITINKSEPIEKLVVTVINPVKFEFNILKRSLAGSDIANTEFEVNSQISGVKTLVTDANGEITIAETNVLPGIYKYEIRETQPANAKYSNVFKDSKYQYKIVIYVKVDPSGEIYLVNQNGNRYKDERYAYEILTTNNENVVNSNIIQLIKENVELSINRDVINENDGINTKVTNPVNYIYKLRKIDCVGNEISGSKFTVIKDGKNIILNNVLINGEQAETFKYEKDGFHYMDIAENSSVPNSSYVNVLDGMFVRFYYNVRDDGTIKIKDNEDNTVDNYFEIYKGLINNPDKAVLLDKNSEEGSKIYDMVSINVDETEDGINRINLDVKNPIIMNVRLVKKQTGVNGRGIKNTRFTIYKDENKKHENVLTDNEGIYEYTEDWMWEGNYRYIIKEEDVADKRYVNILKNKYMAVPIEVDSTGNIYLDDYKGYYIYNNDGQQISEQEQEKLSKYINVSIDESKSIKTLVVEIKNPVELEFNLYKETIDGQKLGGANFTINRTMVNPTNTDGTLSRTETTASNGLIRFDEGWTEPGIYKYEITENSVPGEQYINILNDNKIVVFVKLDPDGTVTYVANTDGTQFPSNTTYKYYIRKKDGTVANQADEITALKYSRLEVGETLTHDKIDVTIVNPIQYEIDIIKKDERNNPLDGTRFTVMNENGELLINHQSINETVEIDEKYISSGHHTYYITENSSVPGYINMLENRFIKLRINVTDMGEVTFLGPNDQPLEGYYELYEGSLNNVENARKLEIATLQNTVGISRRNINGKYRLNIEVANPDIIFDLEIDKKIFGNDEHEKELGYARFTVESSFSGLHTSLSTSHETGKVSIREKNIPAGTYIYRIRETRAPGKHFVNILGEDKYIIVIVRVKSNGAIEIINQNQVLSPECFYLATKDRNAYKIIDPATTVIDDFIRVGTTDGDRASLSKIPKLDIYIKNPEFYNFEIIKKDVDTNERMNNVDFDVRVFDENNNEITLKKASVLDKEELQPAINGTLTTGNVNGKDGVIRIPDILIEKEGTYTFLLHELSTDGKFDWLYKTHATDIAIKVKVTYDENAKEYIIGKPVVSRGEKYTDEVKVTLSKAQTTMSEVTNERIKGSYNLTINKLDSYTGISLEGAEFSISAEKDGKEYTLYESDGNVNSKNVIIPKAVVVDNTLTIPYIRIERPETYTLILTETSAPGGYMLLDKPIKLQIQTAVSGEYDDAEFIVNDVQLIEDENHGLITYDFVDHEITVWARNEYFDLALRKSITSISYGDGTDDGEITEEETQNRIPQVIEEGIKENFVTTATYNHNKLPLRAYANQEVIYTLRVYNEGQIDGYAEEITDHLPEGLEFVNDAFNAERGWHYDVNDPTLRTVKTNHLSKSYQDENGIITLIKAVDKETGKIDYKEIQIKCKISKDVKAKEVLTNIAEITQFKADNRTSETIDRDSQVNNVQLPKSKVDWQIYKNEELYKSYIPGQQDDDDFEKVQIEEFDLALRKYITAVNDEKITKEYVEAENKEFNNSENEEASNETNDKEENKEDLKLEDSTGENEGDEDTKNENVEYYRAPVIDVTDLRNGNSTTAKYTHPKEESPVEVSVDDIVTYTLEVFNEGTVSGYAKLIKDDIPEGLEFVNYEKGDGSINDIYRWKMVDENNQEVTDPKKAKYVISDYLAAQNNQYECQNLISSFDKESMDRPDSRFVQIAFRVICKQDWPQMIKNEAQVADDSDESGRNVKDRDSIPDEWLEEDDEDVEFIKVTYLDLALRKFITGVNDKEIKDREPKVDATQLIKEIETTAKYEHTKEPLEVHTNDLVTYTIRVYNEGSKKGYATRIKDDIPEGLEFIKDNEINKEYEWVMLDENDEVVTDASKAKYIATEYLSKDKDSSKRRNMMKAFDKDTMTVPDSREVKVTFKVHEPTTSGRIITNYAQISKETDGKGIVREDRDSTPNVWKGEDDEDIEKIRVLYFDLALRKWVTKAIVVENGKTNEILTGHHAEDDPEEVVKVDLKKSKVNSSVVKFEYQIRVTNEGEVEGYAKEIKDHIPEGLKFEAVDNPTWIEVENGIIATEDLKDTLLQPGESAEVSVILTWINGVDNMGVKTNIAEISKDYNVYETPDIDSKPDNFVQGEDDIDDAPIMLTIRTGEQSLVYMLIGLGVLVILAIGISLIKDERKKNK